MGLKVLEADWKPEVRSVEKSAGLEIQSREGRICTGLYKVSDFLGIDSFVSGFVGFMDFFEFILYIFETGC